MSDTDALYQELILEHNRKPKNFREMSDANRRIEGRNPLCGDSLTLWVKLNDDRVEDISFKGSGCAISVASSSLMTERVKGSTIPDALRLFDQVHGLLTGAHDHESAENLDKLAALSGVRHRQIVTAEFQDSPPASERQDTFGRSVCELHEVL